MTVACEHYWNELLVLGLVRSQILELFRERIESDLLTDWFQRCRVVKSRCYWKLEFSIKTADDRKMGTTVEKRKEESRMCIQRMELKKWNLEQDS